MTCRARRPRSGSRFDQNQSSSSSRCTGRPAHSSAARSARARCRPKADDETASSPRTTAKPPRPMKRSGGLGRLLTRAWRDRAAARRTPASPSLPSCASSSGVRPPAPLLPSPPAAPPHLRRRAGQQGDALRQHLRAAGRHERRRHAGRAERPLQGSDEQTGGAATARGWSRDPGGRAGRSAPAPGRAARLRRLPGRGWRLRAGRPGSRATSAPAPRLVVHASSASSRAWSESPARHAASARSQSTSGWKSVTSWPARSTRAAVTCMATAPGLRRAAASRAAGARRRCDSALPLAGPAGRAVVEDGDLQLVPPLEAGERPRPLPGSAARGSRRRAPRPARGPREAAHRRARASSWRPRLFSPAACG